MRPVPIEKLNDFEKMFYEHFTKRQESNNDFLLRLLLIVGSVIFGYGYLLLRLDIEKYEDTVILFMLVFTEVLLMLYFKIIYDEGYAFRRDQLVVFRILRKYGLIAENPEENKDKSKVFSFYYNPLKNFCFENNCLKKIHKRKYFWLPAFHNTLASSIFLIHLLIYISFCIKIQDTKVCLYAIVFGLVTITISVMVVVRKHSWLKKLYTQEFIALQND